MDQSSSSPEMGLPLLGDEEDEDEGKKSWASKQSKKKDSMVGESLGIADFFTPEVPEEEVQRRLVEDEPLPLTGLDEDEEEEGFLTQDPIAVKPDSSPKGTPEEYFGVEDYGADFPDPKQIYHGAVKMAEWVNENLIGEWITNPRKVYQEVSSGDWNRIREAVNGLTLDTVSNAAQLTGIGAGVKYGSKIAQTSLAHSGPLLSVLYKGLGKVPFVTNISPRGVLAKLGTILGPLLPNSAGNNIWENVSGPITRGLNKVTSARFLPSEGTKKSLADIFQPSIERLGDEEQRIIRKAAADKSIVSSKGFELSKAEAGMSIQERFDISRELLGIKGTSSGAKAARKVLKDWKTEVGAAGVDKQYLNAFQKVVGNQVKKEFLTDPAFLRLPSTKKFVQTMDQVAGGSVEPKVVQKVLEETITNSNVPIQVQMLARDLYNLTYTTPIAIGEASKKTSMAMMVNQLKAKGIVKASMPTGGNANEWWISKFPGLVGSYVPRDVEMELRTIMDIPKMLSGNGILSKMNRYFMSPWKVSKLMLSPPAHFRNMMSNMILNDWGGLPFYRLDIYKQAAQEMKSKGKFWRELQKETGMGGNFSIAEIEEITGGMKYGASGLDHAFSKFEQLTSVPRRLYNAEEQWFKTAKYIWNRNQGMTTYEAAMDSMKWTFNYGEITRATAAIRGSVAPFFTWTSKVIPLMVETAVKHPVRFAKWPLMFMGMEAAAWENQNVNDEEKDWLKGILPDYMRQGAFFMLPWRDSKDRLQMLNMTYIMPGLGDVTDIMRDPAASFFGSPYLTLTADILRNKTYSGAPVWHDWEDGSTIAAKIGVHFFQNLMPNISALPGTIDFNNLWDTITETPEAKTWGQIMASQVGLRVAPINEEAMVRRREALDNIHRADIGSKMKAELRSATSDSEAAKIVDKYSRLRERLEGKIAERYGQSQ